MGYGYKGGAESYHSLHNNVEKLVNEYPLTSGYFGKRGESNDKSVRNIESSSPLETAKDFYNKAAYGGIEVELEPGKWKTTMLDGTVFTMRIVSGSDGSPAVDINVRRSTDACGIKTQKIHFVQRKDPR